MARLLVVEDTPTLLITLAEALEAAGYQVDTAANAQLAQQSIRPPEGPQPTYAAILTDFNLGDTDVASGRTGMNVFEYARRVLHPMPPFIGSSSEMRYWEPFKKNENIHLIPKSLGGWTTDAVLAKLTELGIPP